MADPVVEHAGPVDETGGQEVYLLGAHGPIRGRLHDAVGDTAVLWVFGAGGGLGGPAGGVYERLGRRVRRRGARSLQLDYRRPGRLDECVADVFAGLTWLEGRGARRIALVGHSFGGAVVIRAGALRDSVVGVAALSSQTAGTDRVADLGDRALLLAHGLADEVLPAGCTRDIERRATGPKEVHLYPGCRHGLDECRDALDRDLEGWLARVLRLPLVT